MVRVLVVDDQRTVREGWSLLLGRCAEISVVGQARDGREAVELAGTLRPDVILMDFQMPRLNGVQALGEIVGQPNPARVLMVTMSSDETILRAALLHGGWGYIVKSDAFDELVPAILAVRDGRLFFSRSIRALFPDVAAAEAPHDTSLAHVWADPAWLDLQKRMERAQVQARVRIDSAEFLCRQSQTLCTQLNHTLVLADQILRQRRPAAFPDRHPDVFQDHQLDPRPAA